MRRVRFSLRAAICFVFVICCLGAVFAEWQRRAKQQRVAVEELSGVGGFVMYDYQDKSTDGQVWQIEDSAPPNPFLAKCFGIDSVCVIAGVWWPEGTDSSGQVVGQVNDSSIRKLRRFPHLRKISLSGTVLTDSGTEALTSLTKLESVSIRGPQLGDQTIKHLLSSKEHLSLLDLNGTRITDEGIQQLTAFPKLQHLDLGNTRISRRSFGDLAKLKRLRSLRLRRVDFEASDIHLLAKLKDLSVLDISDCRCDSAAIDAFHSSRPGLELFR